MKLEWALATLVAGGAAGSAGPPAQPPTASAVAINYSRDVGWSGTLAIEIQRTGESTVFATFNDDGRPEIGMWRSAVSPAKFEQLLELLHRSGYAQLPAPASVPPGTRLVSIGERLAGQDVPTICSFASLPQSLVATVTFLEELRNEIRTHPIRVLRGSATWKTSTFDRGSTAVLEVAFTNIGTSILHMANPLAEGDGWNGLRLVFKPVGGGSEKQEDLAASDLRLEPSANRVGILPLASGQSIRFEVRKKLALSQGRHASRIEYHTVQKPARDADFVGGVVSIDAGDITVKSDPWWKVW